MTGRHTRFLRSLAIIAVFLSPTVSANQKCLQIREDYDLHSLTRKDNVLLIVYDGETRNTPFLFCDKLLENPTPQKISVNGRATVFAHLEVTATTRSFANTLNVDHFPSFLFIPFGVHDSSKYSDHIAIFKQHTDELDTTAFSDFMVKYVGFSPLGNHVFTIRLLHNFAALFASYGNASGLNRLKQKGLVLFVKIVTVTGIWKEPNINYGEVYYRAFAMSLEHGVDCCRLELDRIEQTLQAGHLGPGEYHQLLQKRTILQAFSQPVSEAELKGFIYSVLLFSVGFTWLFLMAIGYVPLPALEGDESEDDESEEDEAINDVPVIAKVVDDK